VNPVPLTAHLVQAVLSAGFQSLVPLIIDHADSIPIPEKGVVLYLYAHLQNNQEIGRVVRYVRDATASYTQTDVLLFPPVEAPH
jgi:hypothetical protein